MTRKIFASLVLVSVIFATNTSVFSAELKKHERLFTEEYSRVFDAAVAVLTEKGFGTHPHNPHKKMKHKKEKGRIKTPEWRYFKIWSAKPVVEKQYKDSYKIKVKEIEIEVPQPVAEKKADDAPETPQQRHRIQLRQKTHPQREPSQQKRHQRPSRPSKKSKLALNVSFLFTTMPQENGTREIPRKKMRVIQ